MCVFTVVMTYSITCPIIVPFGRHRRAGTWALLGGTQDLTPSTLGRQAAPSGQGPGWETGPSGLPPGPWLSLGPGLRGRRGKASSAQGGPTWGAGPLGTVTPPRLSLSRVYRDTHHTPTDVSAYVYTGAVGTCLHGPIDSGRSCVQGGAGSHDLGESLFFLKFSKISLQLLPSLSPENILTH